MREKRVPLAIVGIGCRMPGGITNPDELWKMISSGKDGICEVPNDRWDWRRYFNEDPEAPGKIYVRSGGFLQQDIRQFDAEFFGISPREAMSLDPQQRLLLETSWEAIEDAGLSLDRIAGSPTGVYIGGLTLDNMLTQMSAQNCQTIGPHSAASSTMTMLSNRLSYFLDLHGPSLSVDTACSSSLVAFHLACQAIWNRECEMALVGAVNVIFRPEYMVAMCKGQFLSPDGRSKSFDQRADGYGRGEGAGVIVVKPCDAALRDGDRIYAVVRAIGCNQDGKTNGITVPNPEAQKSLILSVLEQAQVPADKIHYIEAHGTGTPIGDPIEARAIGETLGVGRDDGERLIMGSVKANLGHLEAASGVAALIKLCMCYKYGAIPPLANLGEPNRSIPFDQLGLRLPTTCEPLPDQDHTYFAINSFGYGGTNAHAILENPPVPVAPARDERRQLGLLPISARSETALRAMVALYSETLRKDRNKWLQVCAAAGLRRTHHNFRVAFVGGSCDELIAQIDEWLSSAASTGRRVTRIDGRTAKPVFVFSGMGPQWWGMGQQLFEREPVYADFVTRADAEFQAVAGWSILEEMRRGKDESRINQTIYAQPAIFVLQAGLFELLKSWGVHPEAVIGHSLGENASAYAAGFLTLDQALRVGYHRSQILARAAGIGGGMLAAGVSEGEAQILIAPFGGRVSIAAINGPNGVTLSGEAEALDEIASRLQVKSIFNRTLQVEVAYHSSYMDPLKQPLIDALSDIRPGLPSVDVYSTVTGALATESAYDGPYWAQNIRQSVQFLSAIESSIADGRRLFLEVGAHPVLTASIREAVARTKVDVDVVSTLVREKDECKTLFNSLASLYTAGCDLDWASINGGPVSMLSLPAYPWQRETRWDETVQALEERVGGPPTGLQGPRLDMHEPVWERVISNKYLPYLDDHVVQKLVLLPGAAFVDAALSLQKEVGDGEMPLAIEDLHFRQPLVVDHNDEVFLRSVLDPQSRQIAFHGRPRRQTVWTRHAEARLSAKILSRPQQIDIDKLRASLGDARDVAAFYSRLAKLGLNYGSTFRSITELRANTREILAKVTLGESSKRYDIEHVLHPALLDGAFQSLLAAIDGDDATSFVPASIERVAVFEQIPNHVWCYGQVTRQDGDSVVGDLLLIDDGGRVLGAVSAIRCARIAHTGNGHAGLIERRLFRPVWQQLALDSNQKRAGAWLILAEDGFEEGSFPAQLMERLRRHGTSRIIAAAVDVSGSSDMLYSEAVRFPEDWRTLFEEHPAESLAGLAYLASDADSGNVERSIIRASHLLELFKQLPANESNLRAYLVTQRAQAVEAADLVEGFLQASAAGLFRVAHNEYPGLTCSVIDHDGEAGSAEHVAAELLADDETDDVAWRKGVRYAQRIEARTLLDLEKDNLARRAVSSVDGECYTLACTESGLATTGDPRRDLLYWKRVVPPELVDDELEIEVAHWHAHDQGVGQRQLTALEWTRPQWREFSGRVSRVGPSVKRWRLGESIAAAAFCRLASYAVVRESGLRGIKMDDAPSAASSELAITAASIHVALHQIARATAGESMLVVGAQHSYAAESFSLAARKLGLHLVTASADGQASGEVLDVEPLDLRRDDFANRVLAANHGLPVDIVVFCGGVSQALHNRIPLAFSGRVVLHGTAAESIDTARLFDPATMYSLHRINPDALAASNSVLYQAALADLALPPWSRNIGGSDLVSSAGELPRQSFSDFRPGWSLTIDMSVMHEVVPSGAGNVAINAEAAYVISGGFGGFGMAVAQQLIDQGARFLVLIGRSGATSSEGKHQIAAWRAQGVNVREALLDITSADAVDALFAELSADRAVKGVIHAAGAVDDARIGDMTHEQLVKVMRPKLHGAWNLHVSSLKHRLLLDHFVLFSSVASLVGNGGQANYVAANAALDSFAAYRRSLGLAASSINWGALADVGMATNEDLLRQFRLMGITPFSADEAMSGLNVILRYQPTQIGIMDVDWVQWGKFEPTGGKSLRFAHLTGKRSGALDDSLAGSLRGLPAEEQFAMAEFMLAERVAQTLRIPPERIDVKQPLTEMGIDSLMAVELQIAINMTFGVEFSALELTRGFCISQLTTPLLERMGISAAVDQVDVDNLSEAELDALLAGAESGR